MPASGRASKRLGMRKTTAKSCVTPSHPAPRTLRGLLLGTLGSGGGSAFPNSHEPGCCPPCGSPASSVGWVPCCWLGPPAGLGMAAGSFSLGGFFLFFWAPLQERGVGRGRAHGGGQRWALCACPPFSAFLCWGEVDGNLLRQKPQKKKKGKSAKSSQLHTLRVQGARRRGAESLERDLGRICRSCSRDKGDRTQHRLCSWGRSPGVLSCFRQPPREPGAQHRSPGPLGHPVFGAVPVQCP